MSMIEDMYTRLVQLEQKVKIITSTMEKLSKVSNHDLDKKIQELTKLLKEGNDG